MNSKEPYKLLLDIDEEAWLTLGDVLPRPCVVIVGGSAFNWNLLEHVVKDKDEAMASALSSRRYDEMLSAFERYKKRWRP